MLLFFLIAIKRNVLNDGSNMQSSFSFKLNQKNELTLTNPRKYIINKQKGHILKKQNAEGNQGQWYYVHFLKNDHSKLEKYIKIHAQDELIKDTFVLFLTQSQIEMISNISLIKKIESYEKFSDDKSLENCNKLIVFTSPNYELPVSNNDYIIKNKNGNSYIIKVLKKNLNEKDFTNKKKEVIRFLSNIPQIRSISTYTKPVPANALNAGFTQKNSFDFKRNNSSNFYYLERYMNNKGFTGENQIITILDTPIDFYHAMFRDDNVQVKINTYLPNHRKIVYYGFNGSLEELKDKIKENEHGTHVAGTSSGKSICQNDKKGTYYFNGIAPESKILFGGHFNEVQPIQLQKLMNSYNSRISSNSWGITSFYNPMNYEYGSIAEKNPNITFIFCSGNEYDINGNFTIRDPSGSKNVLTVGAIDDFYKNDSIFNITSKDDPNLWVSAFGVFNDPWFIGSIGTEPGKTDIFAVDADKGNQCNLLNQNKIFLFFGQNFGWIKNCSFDESANALFVKDYETMEKILYSKKDISVSKVIEMNSTKRILKSYYSSTGPANKGILKPDVMAPGTQIISAKSRIHSNSPHGCRDDNEGDFTIKDGTSMATPNVAGAAALIHQYFLSGDWIDKVYLDGDTTRALLINSCRHPFDSRSPDIVFGHGVVDLSTILPVEEDFGVQITYQSQNQNNKNGDQKPSVKENGHLISTINVDTNISKNDLQITLSYTDTMLNMDSPIPLTRDIDIIVISPSKEVFYGDHLENGDTQHLSTNEKIIIKNDKLEDGDYTVHIYGSYFADSGVPGIVESQKFAVVASGPIDDGYIEFAESMECPCEKCNPNHPGFCLCNESQELGPLCHVNIETVKGNEGAFFLRPLEIKRVRFISENTINYVFSKSKYPGRDSTIWVSKNCHLNLGEYETNGFTYYDFDAYEARTKVNFGTNEVCIAIFNNNDKETSYVIEVSETTKFNWPILIIFIETIVIIIFIVIFCYLCCCNKRTRCCCKKKNEVHELESVLQNSLQDNLINNNNNA
ncbi:hypothetical protein M9Y10_037296 [Tritrichomonas musculus]|uniref:Peptidase S8/S53 domain-containing protein n=1 Tax=Tritrichomonas musculus TaxID=1915356 RepID=A0ABR2GS56_9EUKA